MRPDSPKVGSIYRGQGAYRDWRVRVICASRQKIQFVVLSPGESRDSIRWLPNEVFQRSYQLA